MSRLPQFEKNFYKEHPAVVARSDVSHTPHTLHIHPGVYYGVF